MRAKAHNAVTLAKARWKGKGLGYILALLEFGWWRAKPPEGREDGARPTERCQGATPSRPWLARGSDPSADEKTVSGEEPCFKKKQGGAQTKFCEGWKVSTQASYEGAQTSCCENGDDTPCARGHPGT